MGDIVVFGYALLGLAGLVLVALGVWRRSRAFTLTGAGILLGILGAWVLGLAGAGLALVVVPIFWSRRSPRGPDPR